MCRQPHRNSDRVKGKLLWVRAGTKCEWLVSHQSTIQRF
ncbi:hypothetical protein RSAG8_13258, partial [Rhizoctonia solani AG-8 WAC10335]